MEKELEQLKRELIALKAEHSSAWEQYGSELCAQSLIDKEKELEDKIRRYSSTE